MGTVTNLNGFFKPELSGYKNIKRKKRKPKKGKSKNTHRLKVTRHFGVNEYATNASICFCIHRETGWDIPGKANGYRRFIAKFSRTLTQRKREYKKPSDIEKFYSSKQWKELRFVALRLAEGRCGLCGARASDGVQLQVDHIKPRSKYPELELDLDNLQILCEDCNYGKSNYDDTDYRAW